MMKTRTKAPTSTEEPWIETVRLPLDKVKPSPTNPRKHFDPAAQDELEASMREHGFTISTLLVRPMLDAYYLEPVGEEGLCEVCRRMQDGAVIREGTLPRREAEERLRAAEGCYELVAGERRWRAARAVGIQQAPAIIRLLSDQQVLELQLVENLQRTDLTAIEEAEGMARLLALRDETGQPVYTCALLAQKLGFKNVRTVEKKVKLALLTGATRAAVEGGVLAPKTAMLIASIPDETVREKAAAAILKPKYEQGPLSFERASDLVQRDFLCDLRGAPFAQDDATLLPVEYDAQGVRCAGGACKDCPLRVGNLKDVLEQEIKSGQHQLCLNPSCFNRKKETDWAKWQARETNPAKRRRALSEKECRDIYNYGDQLAWNCGMVDLEQCPDEDDLKPGVESAPTWKKLIKGAELEVLVARDRNGKMHEVVGRTLAIQAAQNNGHDIFGDVEKTEAELTRADLGVAVPAELALEEREAWLQARPSQDEIAALRKAQALEEDRDRQIKKRLDDAKMDAVVAVAEKAKKLPAGFWQMLAAHEADMDGLYNVRERRGLDDADFAAQIPNDSDGKIIGYFVELMADYRSVESLARVAKLYDVDLKAVEKQVKAELKAEEKAAAEEAKAKAKAEKEAKAKTDQKFLLDEIDKKNVCPDCGAGWNRSHPTLEPHFLTCSCGFSGETQPATAAEREAQKKADKAAKKGGAK